jgi:hypothetical protein
MGKIVLNETQYNRLKNILISHTVDKFFFQKNNIQETISSERSIELNGARIKLDNLYKKVSGYNFTHPESSDVSEFTKLMLNPKNCEEANLQFKSYKYGPSQIANNFFNKFVLGDRLSEDSYKYKSSVDKIISHYKKIGYQNVNVKLTNDERTGNPTYKKSPFNFGSCETSKIEKINQGGGGEDGKKTYEQAYDQKLKYNTPQERYVNGYKMTFTDLKIPAKTIYTFLPEKNAVSFKFKNGNKMSFGWFGCKSKKFSVDKIPLTDEKQALTKKLVSELCKVVDSKKEEIIPQNQVVYTGGGGSEKYDTSEFDLYI